MFFSASKILWFFLTPSNLILLALLFGTSLLWTRAWPLGRKLIMAALLFLILAGLSPLGNLLLLPLENRFPQWEASSRSPAGIIVLGGSQETTVTIERGQISLNESAERMTEAAMLARRYPLAKLVFTGGDGGLLGGAGNEADDAENLFVKLGVPSSQLIMERASRNTYENAGLVAKAMQPKPGEVWLLVTSAAHMPRAVGCFRKAGIYVTPYPVDYRTRGWLDATSFSPSLSDGLGRVDGAAHEWLGLVVYKVLGYTDALFPRP
jgi:uncharacterized SAM-binding protein YcdF (DUF218 family)